MQVLLMKRSLNGRILLCRRSIFRQLAQHLIGSQLFLRTLYTLTIGHRPLREMAGYFMRSMYAVLLLIHKD